MLIGCLRRVHARGRRRKPDRPVNKDSAYGTLQKAAVPYTLEREALELLTRLRMQPLNVLRFCK